MKLENAIILNGQIYVPTPKDASGCFSCDFYDKIPQCRRACHLFPEEWVKLMKVSWEEVEL